MSHEPFSLVHHNVYIRFYRFSVMIVLQMYCYYKCSVTLPHGAVEWSAVCDVVFPDHTHFLLSAGNL